MNTTSSCSFAASNELKKRKLEEILKDNERVITIISV
jgi:hypothetical protein